MTILGMSLKINNWRYIAKWVAYVVAAVLFMVFLVRVMVFEQIYYTEKEGSERAITEEGQVGGDEDLDETEPTETEILEYVVPPDQPRYLTIEELGIRNARILPMGIKQSGELDTPRNIFDTGWYTNSGKPGQGGTLFIDGHNGGPRVRGVFKDLPTLIPGDVIQVERGDGLIYRYVVVENNTVPLEEADNYMTIAAQSPELGVESLTLISCTGDWSQQQQTYLSRQFVRAILIED